MKGKKAMLSFTLGGQPHMFGHDGIHGEIDIMLRPILRGSLAYAGFTVPPPYAAYHVPYISHEARQEILFNCEQRLLNLDALVPLSFPNMGDFDDRLYAKT